MLAHAPASAKVDAERYWDFLDEVVGKLFGGRGADRIEPLKRQLAGRPVNEQTLFYHREPIDVAGELADVEEISDDALETYRRLKVERGWAAAAAP